MKKPLHEKIIDDAKKEAKIIVDETTKFVDSYKDEHLNKIKNEFKNRVKTEEENYNLEINSYKKKLEFDLKGYNQKVKNDLLKEVFNEVYEELSSLEKNELLNFINILLKDFELEGLSSFIVNKEQEEKYLKALSSKYDKDNLDLLNALNKSYNFSLKTDDLYFDNGFMLVSEDFDLIFNFEEIVANYKTKYEKEIYKKLFEYEK